MQGAKINYIIKKGLKNKKEVITRNIKEMNICMGEGRHNGMIQKGIASAVLSESYFLT